MPENISTFINEPVNKSYCNCTFIDDGEPDPPEPGNFFLNSLGRIKLVESFIMTLSKYVLKVRSKLVNVLF
ncbi:hypothetical protein SNUCP2_35730 (plasmid) [Clostridium perfringens A]